MKPKMRYDAEDNVLMIWLAEGKAVDHAGQSGSVELPPDGVLPVETVEPVDK